MTSDTTNRIGRFKTRFGIVAAIALPVMVAGVVSLADAPPTKAVQNDPSPSPAPSLVLSHSPVQTPPAVAAALSDDASALAQPIGQRTEIALNDQPMADAPPKPMARNPSDNVPDNSGDMIIAAAAAADDTSNATPDNQGAAPIDATMAVDFYFGGLHVGTAQLNSRLYDDRYEMVTTGHGTGLASLFTQGRHGTISATGQIVDGKVNPQVYGYTVGTDEQVEQQTQVTFHPDAPVTIEASPAYPEDKRRYVPLEEQLGTLDPLSSALFHLTLGENDNPCGETVRIFDGRRRFDLHTRFIEDATLRKSRYNAYHGKTIKCEAVFERIKGFDETATEMAPTGGKNRIKRRSKTYDPALVWLAPIPVVDGAPGETLLLPVKVSVATGYGTIMVHLKDYDLRRTGQSAAAPRGQIAQH